MIKSILFKSFSFVIYFLVSSQVFALKEYPLIDQRQIEATLSNRELNRITVIHDRIRQVFGADGAFAHEVDEEGGQLFIKPLDPQQQKPLHLTIVTENGLTQDLKLTFADIDAETIILKQSKEVSVPHEEHQPPLVYQESLIEIIQAMGRDEDIEGYQKLREGSPLEEGSRVYPPDLQAICVSRYDSSLWQGLVYDLHNASESSLDLKEQELSQPGDLAVAVEEQHLNSEGRTRLYVISKRQRDL